MFMCKCIDFMYVDAVFDGDSKYCDSKFFGQHNHAL